MNSSTKWIIASIGFTICFYLGWFFPALWLIFLIGVLVLVMTPSKKPKATPVEPMHAAAAVTQPAISYTATTSNDDELQLAIQERIRNARNDDVREGLQQALEEIQRLSQAQEQDPMYAAEFLQESTYPAQPAVATPEQLAAEKQKQELRNTNTILYVASFLLVGAAALFIGLGTNLPETVKFVLVLLVAMSFYGVGIVLYSRSAKLRPAAVAFVGTGLALIPFVGLAFYSYVITDGPLVWWLTSLIGLMAFWLALLRIKTSVIAYLTVAFVFSLATSSVSALHAPFVWYFVAIIVTSSLLMYLSYKLPKWMPQQLQLPLEQNAQLATPVALIGSGFMINQFGSLDYALITGVATLHYAVNALGYKTNSVRYVYWVAARALALVFAMTFTYYVVEDWRWVALTLMIGSLLLHAGAVVGVKNDSREAGWLWVVQPLLFLALTGWIDTMLHVSVGLGVIALVSLHQLYIMKRVEFSVAGIIAAVLLPFAFGRGVAEPAVAFEHIGLIGLTAAGLVLAVRAWLLRTRLSAYQQAATGLYIALLGVALFCAVICSDAVWFGVISLVVAGAIHVVAFVEKQPYAHLVSNFVATFATYALYAQIIDNSLWTALATAWTLGASWYALRWCFNGSDNSSIVRRESMLFSSVAILLLAAIYTTWPGETAVAASLTGVVVMVILAYEGYVRKQRFWYEVAAYGATVFVQRLAGYFYPDINVLIYTHWWAATVAAMLLLNKQQSKDALLTRSIIALALFSVPTALYALSEGGAYQLLFLLEHVALTVIGAMLSKKLALQWGAIGVGASLLWMLKGYTYILLALLAFGLIGFAVWRLLKKN